MACGLALKRPHEYDSYLSEPSEAKRARASAHCSPFRPQLGTIAASLPSSSSLPTNKDDSPFASVSGAAQLSSPQLESYLRAEIRYLRRRKLIPRRTSESTEKRSSEPITPPRSAKPADYRAPKSPQSGSDSEGECSTSRRRDAMAPLYEKPQFSLKQVQMICERLLKEQEMRLRFEYETALTKKLDEQHEQYVQFAAEQLHSRVAESSSADFSYLS